MDDFKNIVIEERQEKVKNKVLELIQCWSSAFEKSPEYKIVCDTHAYMKMYGYDFPKLKEADAMFMADSAPEWAEGESCFRLNIYTCTFRLLRLILDVVWSLECLLVNIIVVHVDKSFVTVAQIVKCFFRVLALKRKLESVKRAMERATKRALKKSSKR